MKYMLLIIIFLCLPTSTFAQHRIGETGSLSKTFQREELKPGGEDDFFSPYGKGFKVSISALVATTAYDAVRSKQKISTGRFREQNPFLRNKQGGLSMPKYVVFNSIFIGATILLERKHPKLAAFIRLFASGGHVVAAEMK